MLAVTPLIAFKELATFEIELEPLLIVTIDEVFDEFLPNSLAL